MSAHKHTITLTEAQAARLNQLTHYTGLSAKEILAEAVELYLEQEAEFIALVDQALDGDDLDDA